MVGATIRLERNFEVLSAILAWLLLFISPLLGFLFSSFIFYFLYNKRLSISGLFVVAHSVVITISYGLIVTSISPDLLQSNDFYNYYVDYSIIQGKLQSALMVINRYADSLEPGLPLVFYTLSLIKPDLSYQELLFIFSSATFAISFFWILDQARHLEKKYSKGLIIFSFVILFSTSVGGQLLRQGLAMGILLYAVTSEKFYFKCVLLFVAGLFHLAAYPVFFIIYFSKRYGFVFFLVIIASLLPMLILFDWIINSNGIALIKFSYYQAGYEAGISSVEIGTLKWFAVAAPFVALSIFFRRKSSIKDMPKIYNNIGGHFAVLIFLTIFFTFINYY